ncbi:uncharacterized [Tachysurus ichikawai]
MYVKIRAGLDTPQGTVSEQKAHAGVREESSSAAHEEVQGCNTVLPLIGSPNMPLAIPSYKCGRQCFEESDI